MADPRKPLPITTPAVVLGRKTFVVRKDDWKGNPQVVIEEAKAVQDPKDATKNIGYEPVFKGTRLSGAPDAVRDFLSNARGLVAQLAQPPAEAPSDVPAPRGVAKP